MRRHETLGTKVLFGFHESFAEQPCPDPVDHDPGSQGVVLIHQPTGDAQPVRRSPVRQFAKQLQYGRWDLFSLIEEITSVVYSVVAMPDGGQFAHDRSFRKTVFQFVHFVPGRFELCVEFTGLRVFDFFKKPVK